MSEIENGGSTRRPQTKDERIRELEDKLEYRENQLEYYRNREGATDKFPTEMDGIGCSITIIIVIIFSILLVTC